MEIEKLYNQQGSQNRPFTQNTVDGWPRESAPQLNEGIPIMEVKKAVCFVVKFGSYHLWWPCNCVYLVVAHGRRRAHRFSALCIILCAAGSAGRDL